MATRINTNVLAMSAARYATINDGRVANSIEKLSSGLRINRASDDAAGLTISEKLRAQVSGLDQAVRNSNDAINLVKTAEGALTEVHELLRTMRTLAVHAASVGTNSGVVSADQQQLDSAAASISRIASSTVFNGTKLLDGTFTSATATFQIGANSGDTTYLAGGIGNISATVLSVDGLVLAGAVSATTGLGASAALAIIDTAITTISSARSALGSFQKQVLESNVRAISITKENISASESAIRDTDMAGEMVEFTKNNILSQASQAMLSQANNASQGILQLLRG